MGPYQSQWRSALARMVADRGQGATLPGSDVACPRLVGLDFVLLLAQYTQVVRAVVVEYNRFGETIFPSDVGDAFDIGSDVATGNTITVDEYLGKAIPHALERASRRYITRSVGSVVATYGPYEPDAKWSGMLELVSSWQNLVNNTATVLTNGPQLEVAEPMIAAFCGSIDQAAYEIDVTNTMPSSYLGAVKYTIVGGLTEAKNQALSLTHDAVIEAGKLGGEALATAGDAAGQGFAAFVKSFLGSGSVMALAVAAIAVYAWHAGVI